MFADGGGASPDGTGHGRFTTSRFPTDPSWSWSGFVKGAASFNWYPAVTRHRAKGGVVGVYADGHAAFLRVVRWGRPIPGSTAASDPSARVPTQFSPNPRITPYEPWGPTQVPPNRGGGGGTTR